MLPNNPKFLGPAVFALLACAFLVVLPWPNTMPGSLDDGDGFECDLDVAVAVFNHIDAVYVDPVLKNLPPPQEISEGQLSIGDTDDRTVEVVLGAWEHRLDKVCRAVARAQSDIVCVPWWKDQLHKANRSVRRKLR